MQFPTKRTAILTGHQGPIHCVEFSAGSGQYVLTGSADRSIRLYNPLKSSPSVPSSGLIQSYDVHGYEVLDLAITADNGRFASVGGDKQVFLWDVSTARTLKRWSGHFGRVNCVDLGGEDGGVVVSGSFDATVRIWDTKSQAIKPIQVLDEAKDSISSIAVVGWDIIAGCVDGRLRVYDLRMGLLSTNLVGQSITSVQQSKDGNAILVSTLDSSVRLFDKGNGKVLQSYKGHRNTDYRVRSCFGQADSTVVSGSEDGHIYAWDLLDGEVIADIQAHDGRVISAVAWNNNKPEWVSAGSDGTATIWGYNDMSDRAQQ